MLPTRLLGTRSLRPTGALRQLRLTRQVAPAGRRWASTEPSPYTSFFKTFGRPISKVCLMAIFTYQLVYFGWAKLEQDELKSERQAEITNLEAQVEKLKESKKEDART